MKKDRACFRKGKEYRSSCMHSYATAVNIDEARQRMDDVYRRIERHKPCGKTILFLDRKGEGERASILDGKIVYQR
jgi:hypothetical protein